MKVYIGIDAHTTNYTLATWTEGSSEAIFVDTYPPLVSNIVKYCESLKKKLGDDIEILAGYEAGCLGFTLQRDLEKEKIHCLVLAPNSIVGTEINRRNRKKTDKRDAIAIGKALRNEDYKSVRVPDQEDEAVRDFIRMREDHRRYLKANKQQIVAFCHRHGHYFTEGSNYWTQKHMKWLKSLPLTGYLKETLEGYLLTYEQLTEKIASLDHRIEEIAAQDKYSERVHNLTCLKGVKTVTALAVVSEIGDFNRFPKAKSFSAFLGLVVGQLDSSTDKSHLGISKQGNTFVRRLLVESAQSFSKAVPGKSAALKKRQEGCSEEVIAYADKANERLRKRYHRLVLHNNKCSNKAKVAVARELACFMWGMMTGNMHTVLA